MRGGLGGGCRNGLRLLCLLPVELGDFRGIGMGRFVSMPFFNYAGFRITGGRNIYRKRIVLRCEGL